MVLVYTSFGFGICAFVAALAGKHVYCGLLIALNSCSILHHAHVCEPSSYIGGHIVATVDRTLAHVITAKCLLDTMHCITPFVAAPVWLSVAYVAIIYKTKVQGRKYTKDTVYYWHASMHIASQLGLMYLFWV